MPKQPLYGSPFDANPRIWELMFLDLLEQHGGRCTINLLALRDLVGTAGVSIRYDKDKGTMDLMLHRGNYEETCAQGADRIFSETDGNAVTTAQILLEAPDDLLDETAPRTRRKETDGNSRD